MPLKKDHFENGTGLIKSGMWNLLWYRTILIPCEWYCSMDFDFRSACACKSMYVHWNLLVILEFECICSETHMPTLPVHRRYGQEGWLLSEALKFAIVEVGRVFFYFIDTFFDVPNIVYDHESLKLCLWILSPLLSLKLCTLWLLLFLMYRLFDKKAIMETVVNVGQTSMRYS